MNKKKVTIISVITLGVLMALTFGWVAAQEPEPRQLPQSPASPDIPSKFIPIQGRLTDSGGIPVADDTYNMTFRLYGQFSGGTPYCEHTRLVIVEDGLFSTYFDGTGCAIDGRQLYLGVQVEDDPEMDPRQYIDTVPIAWTLRPGAIISATRAGNSILHIENWGTSGRGFRSYAMDEGSTNYGIVGASRSSAGYGGYFYNNGGGIGLYASTNSASGVGIVAKGTGGGVGLHASTDAASGVAVLAEGVDSGPDLVLGSNANTGTGDDGVITSDPSLVSSDIVIKSNDTVRIDLDNDGNGEDADFEIRNKDDSLIFNVDDSGAVLYGGEDIIAFPRPAYNSNWIPMAQGTNHTLTHGLGGAIDNYVVDFTCRSPGEGINNWGVGGDVNSPESYGGWWSDLTTTQITIHRWNDDTDCIDIRVRIWMYPSE